MEEENPAANNPTPKASEPTGPSFLWSESDNSGKEENACTDVPAMRMAAVIKPPTKTETVSPMRINGMVFPLLMPDPKKILYGTMVVPTNPKINNALPEGNAGTTV